MSPFKMSKQEVACHYGSHLYCAYLLDEYYWKKINCITVGATECKHIWFLGK